MMKSLIFIILIILIPFVSIAQEGGYRSLKIKSEKITHSDLSTSGNILIRIDNNGVEHKLFIDTTKMFFNGDTLKVKIVNLKEQTLIGTSPVWDISKGVNAKITLTGNTVITLSNLVEGYNGNLTVINASSPYSLSFSGYTNDIYNSIFSIANTVITSGGTKKDSFSWRYNGGVLTWNGGNDYKR